MSANDDGGSVVPPGEAALVTRDGMNDLTLWLPKDVDDEDDAPPAVRFLTAVMLRAEEEPGWVESMIKWVDDRLGDEIGETEGEA